MERIKPSQVVDAMKQNNLVAVRAFESFDGRRAVAIQALAIDAGCQTGHDYVRHWSQLSGDDEAYVAAFDYGWMGYFNQSETIVDNQGFVDGVAAWYACVNAGLVDGETA